MAYPDQFMTYSYNSDLWLTSFFKIISVLGQNNTYSTYQFDRPVGVFNSVSVPVIKSVLVIKNPDLYWPLPSKSTKNILSQPVGVGKIWTMAGVGGGPTYPWNIHRSISLSIHELLTYTWNLFDICCWHYNQ